MKRGPVGIVRDWWRRHPSAQFPTRFLLYVFCAIRLSSKVGAVWPAATSGTAHVVVVVSQALGLGAAIQPSSGLMSTLLGRSSTVAFGQGTFSYQVIDECTALLLFGILAAAMLAYPASWRRRITGLLVAAPAIFSLNIVRLVTLGWLGLQHPRLFDHVHVYWWQAFNILVIGFGWLAWVRFVVDRDVRRRDDDRLRNFLVSGTTFALVTAAVGVLGVALHAMEAYRRVLLDEVTPLLNLAVGRRGDVVLLGLRANSSWLYATLAGVAGLFLATPATSWRVRTRGLLLRGMASVALLQVLAPIAGAWIVFALDLHGASAQMVVRTLIVANIGVPVAVWYAWTQSSSTSRATIGPLVANGDDVSVASPRHVEALLFQGAVSSHDTETDRPDRQGRRKE